MFANLGNQGLRRLTVVALGLAVITAAVLVGRVSVERLSAATPTGTSLPAIVMSNNPTVGSALVSPAEAVAASASPSVVNVRVTGVVASPFFGNQPYEGIGSGVIYFSDGYIVTNNHVVSENGTPATSVVVTLSTGAQLPATIVARDPLTDLAIIHVNKTGLPAATFTNLANVKMGEYAIAIGSPLDYRNSVTLGIVSGLGRSLDNAGPGTQALTNLIQTDAPISPGNSGGALLDSSGRVIGLNVAYLPPAQTGAENIGFAIPSDTVVNVANQLLNGGHATHASLGASYVTIDPTVQTQFGLNTSTGVVVTDVTAGGPSQKAGLQPGDIITSVQSQPVAQEGDVVRVLLQKQPGDVISLGVDRNGAAMTLHVTLG
jgi:S1-C subfamily serine protease